MSAVILSHVAVETKEISCVAQNCAQQLCVVIYHVLCGHENQHFPLVAYLNPCINYMSHDKHCGYDLFPIGVYVINIEKKEKLLISTIKMSYIP